MIISRNSSLTHQNVISAVLIITIATICFIFSKFIDYKIVAFLLLVAVSVLAAWLDIKPVILASILSA